MACELARQLKDTDWGACGAFSQIPMAAFKLARMMHAPNLWWMAGGGGAFNSPTDLVDSSTDFKTLIGAEHVFRMEDVVDWQFGGWQRRETVGILGGMQIDRCGNANLTVIGDYHKPTVRGPGTVGLAFAAHFSRMYFYTHYHNPRIFDPRIFVQEVDFVSAVGHGERRRKLVRPHSRGPQRVVTPLATLGFTDDGYMNVISVHPGVALADVQRNTGFELVVPAEIAETLPPTEEELSLLRTQIDRNGQLARLPTEQ
jgi:glutaconate CoA-transferase subunit B